MESAMRWAPVPKPGKFLGQVVTIFHRNLSCEMAVDEKLVAAAAAPTAAPLITERRL